VAQKNDVLAVLSSALINQNDKQYVRLIDDPDKKTYHQVEVQTGLQADGGLVEITSGLSEGQSIVIFIKQ
jgi:multidrug efflux pump subunit AcrA (membrane-fusion protein)